jgi:hypothetical protein
MHTTVVDFFAKTLLCPVNALTTPLKSCVDVDTCNLSARTKYGSRIQYGASASMFNFDLFPNAPLSVRQLLERATWSLPGLRVNGDGYQESECKKCWN